MDLSGSRIVAPVAPATGTVPAAKSRAPRRGKSSGNGAAAPPVPDPAAVQFNDRRQFAHRPGAEHFVGPVKLGERQVPLPMRDLMDRTHVRDKEVFTS